MPTAQRARTATARPARRRAAALRLRRGHAAPAPALVVGLVDLARDLPHPLPCRPLPRPAGDAEDVRAARPRGPAHALRAAAGSRDLLGDAPAHLRPAHLPRRPRRAPPGRRGSSATATRSRRSACEHGVAASATRSSRTSGPGRFDVADADALGVPARARARRAPARRGGHARGRTRRHARPGARAARAAAARS